MKETQEEIRLREAEAREALRDAVSLRAAANVMDENDPGWASVARLGSRFRLMAAFEGYFPRLYRVTMALGAVVLIGMSALVLAGHYELIDMNVLADEVVVYLLGD